MPYPYCCPRSFCPSRRITDIFSNSLESDYQEEELQMAANDLEGSRVMVAAPAQYEVSLESQQYEDYSYDWDKLFGGFY